MSSNLNALFENQSQNNTQGKPEFVKSMLWLNIGYYADVVDEETGEVEKTFVSLPIGVPVDTMKQARTDVSNKNLAQLRAAQNALLEALKQHGLNELQPGEAKALPNLTVELRRVNEEAHIREGENPLTANLAKLF